MEYFDDAWYKCRTKRDVLRSRMTTVAGSGGGGGTFVVFFPKTFSGFFLVLTQ